MGIMGIAVRRVRRALIALPIVGLLLAAAPGLASAVPIQTTAAPSAQPLAGAGSTLVSVSAASASDAWAVGDYVTDGHHTTLAEHWDGTSWAQVKTPNPGKSWGSSLRGVTVIASDDAWAVGSYGTASGVTKTLTMHWDGASWKRVKSPSPGARGDGSLASVSAVSSGDVWAVGSRTSTSIASVTLAEHWDGHQWNTALSPNPSHHGANALSGVSAVSSNDVWAVGSYSPNALTEGTLVAHWNGKRWTRPTSPGSGSSTNRLLAVDAISTTDVWAVGETGTVPGVTTGFIAHWAGAGWVQVQAPDLGVSISSLGGVSGTSSTDVWAVGTVATGTVPQTLITHWDGSAWSVVPSPSPGALGNALSGVLASGPTSAWAVGALDNTLGSTALVEGWNGDAWTTF